MIHINQMLCEDSFFAYQPIIKITGSRFQYDVTNATDIPNIAIIDDATKNIGRRPYLSANGPKIRVPNIAPANNTELIDAASSLVKFHNSLNTSLKKLNNNTCIASAAKQNPAATNT